MSAVETRTDGALRRLPGLATARRHWWRALALVLGLAVAGAIGVYIFQWRASYQALTYGNLSDTAEYYPGLPAGTGIRAVNTFGGVREDIYIPPQRGPFSLFVDLTNNGSRAVTIQSVTLARGGPLMPAGPVVYTRPGGGYGQPAVPLRHETLRNVVLAPGQDLYIGMTVRTWQCAVSHTWLSVPSFYVTYRYSFFVHTVAVSWGQKNDDLIMQGPGGMPGQPGIVCAGR